MGGRFSFSVSHREISWALIYSKQSNFGFEVVNLERKRAIFSFSMMINEARVRQSSSLRKNATMIFVRTRGRRTKNESSKSSNWPLQIDHHTVLCHTKVAEAITNTMTTTSSTKYSWVADLKTGTFLANSRELVRVMGVVTAIGECSSVDRDMLSPLAVGTKRIRPTLAEPPLYNNTHSSLGKELTPTQSNGDDGSFVSVTIDDGTDSIKVCASRTVMQSPSAVTVGKTYDCLLKLKQNRNHKTWVAETFCPVENPIDEHLRWLELGHHDQSLSRSASSRLKYSNLCHKFGFPARKRNRLEAYRLICVNFNLQQQPTTIAQTKRQNLPVRSRTSLSKRRHSNKWITRTPLASQPHRPRGLTSANRSRNTRQEGLKKISPRSNVPISQTKSILKTPSQTKSQKQKTAPPPLDGLLLTDLATVLQKSEKDVQEMIEDLQLEGKIYQNERGEFLPL